jgi:hypothetical protein
MYICVYIKYVSINTNILYKYKIVLFFFFFFDMFTQEGEEGFELATSAS